MKPQASKQESRAPKVFGIGFHKTGTTSLGEALEILGLRVTGAQGVLEEDIAQTALDRALALVPHFDAFQDNPWPILFRELDERFPGSRFVLTIRPPEAWLASVLQHFGGESTPMRRWIYGEGDPVKAPATYEKVYRAHNAAVRAHFSERPDDLLVLDLANGGGWRELCTFLTQNVKTGPFPHSNRSKSSKRRTFLPDWITRRISPPNP